MKITRSSNDMFLLQLGLRERNLFFDLLQRYSSIPLTSQQLSKTGQVPDLEASQRLLDEDLAEQRAENLKQVQAFLADPSRRQPTTGGVQFSLSPAEIEWLLQVLNDIRVGSWVLLGSPEQGHEVLNQKTAPHLWAMEISGYFQMHLLEALEKCR